EEAFSEVNPGLARDAIAVTCDRRRLSEVRICLGKDLGFRPCPEIDSRACRRDKVVMPPVRGGSAALTREQRDMGASVASFPAIPLLSLSIPFTRLPEAPTPRPKLA